MTQLRKKIINIIEELPYNIDEEILKRDTKEILQEITQKYIDLYDINELSEKDIECVQSFIENI